MPRTTTEPPFPLRLIRMDEARRGAYRQVLDFYGGRQWAGNARRGERRLTFNYAKAFAEKVTSYLLLGAAVQIESREEDSPETRRRCERPSWRLSLIHI